MPESEKDILKKYSKKIKKYSDEEGVSESDIKEFSNEYIKFREEALSKVTTKYENWCNAVENVIKIAPPKKILPQLEESIEFAHLNITSSGAASFAVSVSILTIFIALFIGLLTYLLTGSIGIFLPFLLIILSVVIITPLTKLPIYIANNQRLKASNQMVLCILYIVMYMRHTSNLEHAIKFAAEHIEAPLSLDLRKVFWDMETGKFSTIKESLDHYLERWRDYNLEFLNAFHLVESSLYEPSETRRLTLLDKAMEVILEGTYEKMLRYTHELKNPITMLHMLGVVLPILGLVVFPLIGSFLSGLVKWYHLAILYNLILPSIVFLFGLNILSKRPTGYGETQISKELLEKKDNTKFICIFMFCIFLILGFSPLIIHSINPETDLQMGSLIGKFLDYKEVGDAKYGPFGLGALLFSFFIPFGAAFSLGYYYKTKTKQLIVLRNETKKLETEFASSLFQLGNRIGDGIPTELAFSTVAKNMEGTPSGNFFRIVDLNIRQLGMGIKEAIFNKKTGAILSYPSSLVQSSMEVLLESSKKGPQIVATSLISISNYVDRIHQVNERLKDLLAEIISSMKSQTAFLTPAIAGIVVGIASMIVNIIVQLGQKFTEFQMGEESMTGAASSLNTITQLFNVKDIIPGFFFQLVVGIYVVQSVYILTILENGIENGTDKVNEKYLLGKNLYKSVFLYIIIAAIVVVLFNILAQSILAGTDF